MLSALHIPPAKAAGDVTPSKRGGLDALVALYPKVVLVALSPPSRPEALLRPVAGLVRSMAVLADQDLAGGDAQGVNWATTGFARLDRYSHRDDKMWLRS